MTEIKPLTKIRSGVYGLNPLIGGGIIENSTTVVIGSSGAGKTTFALQYIMRGMEVGDDGVFISLDENKNQIIQEAVAMGFTSIRDFIDKGKLVFIDASGEQFSSFIRNELPEFVAEWRGTKSRIVIDPLTPVLWAIKDRYEQRELISFLMKEARKVGTVLCTLEEHGAAGDLSGSETIIPMYIADCIIHLRYSNIEDSPIRKLKIIKCRSSRHSNQVHTYRIIGGLGLTIARSPKPARSDPKLLEKLKVGYKEKSGPLPPHVKRRITQAIKNLSPDDFREMNPDQFIEDIIVEYEF